MRSDPQTRATVARNDDGRSARLPVPPQVVWQRMPKHLYPFFRVMTVYDTHFEQDCLSGKTTRCNAGGSLRI